jgi:hypothetical protein
MSAAVTQRFPIQNQLAFAPDSTKWFVSLTPFDFLSYTQNLPTTIL